MRSRNRRGRNLDRSAHSAATGRVAGAGQSGDTTCTLDQLEQALESALRQAALYGESGDAWGEYLGLCNAAFYECGLGRFDSAIARLRTALEALRQINAPHGEGQASAISRLRPRPAR